MISVNNIFKNFEKTPVLNGVSCHSTKELLEAVHTDVERFVGNAPQFDDLTMLALKHT